MQYKYDALDNRIERTEDSNGDGNVDTTERFGYDGQNVWADLNTNNNITYRRLFGSGVDEPVARITAAGTVVWYLLDYQNSVIGMVDSTGSSLGSVTYDGFGNVLTNTTGVNGDRYAFTSRELDSVTGDWYYRARYYKSAIGKWTSMDPLGFEAGDANLSRYVGNGPTNARDPSGLEGKIETVKESGKTNDPLPGGLFEIKISGIGNKKLDPVNPKVSLVIDGKTVGLDRWAISFGTNKPTIISLDAKYGVIKAGTTVKVKLELNLNDGKSKAQGGGDVIFKGKPANPKPVSFLPVAVEI